MKNSFELKQVFIKCHDNDFWSYYRSVLFTLYYWYSYTYHSHQPFPEEKIQKFIEETLSSLYRLNNDDSTRDGFPWKIKVYLNEEAKEKYNDNLSWGNHESAYMDIESYLITPGAIIDDFIFNV